ncbi:hypothetical protein [Vineibacter terrae]|uniref:hypothetical protein n=1 Tax=Vineibacter terrae TaxID=2586908 RepID=UPI002E3406C1|nr:hypothetical protein [Vineibacter terrae]HEX2885666.1 hypothetical protein [Vineibacter terrae]
MSLLPTRVSQQSIPGRRANDLTNDRQKEADRNVEGGDNATDLEVADGPLDAVPFVVVPVPADGRSSVRRPRHHRPNAALLEVDLDGIGIAGLVGQGASTAVL